MAAYSMPDLENIIDSDPAKTPQQLGKYLKFIISWPLNCSEEEKEAEVVDEDYGDMSLHEETKAP